MLEQAVDGLLTRLGVLYVLAELHFATYPQQR
jgi:hypothetical protein